MILWKVVNLTKFAQRLNLKDGSYTHSQFGPFKIINGKVVL